MYLNPPEAVKIASLLSQYLYNNKRLELPGIGIFLLDASALEAFEASKIRAAAPEGISFESKASVKEAAELIAFISSQTGKMKALASADLDSHLQLAQQFLNIGKPFTFEGIGTLVLAKQGEFQFTPLPIITDKSKDFRQKESGKTSKEESRKPYKSFLDNAAPASSSWRKPVLALLIVSGLALAIWGGYAISKKTAAPKDDNITQTTAVPVQPIVPVEDTSAKKTDTEIVQHAVAMNSSNYKYILEVSNSKRALKRYKQLKTNLWDVQLETKDSVKYKLYLMLPAISADTTRVLDSLTVMTGRRVYIEAQN